MRRSIHPIIETYIDSKIPYLKHLTPGELLVRAMQAMIGVEEEGGNNRGKLVEAIQSTIGRAEGEPWCMSTVQTAIAYVEKKLSLVCGIPASEHCLTVFNDSVRRKLKVDVPKCGDLMVWQMGNTQAGHVGVIIAVEGADSVRTVEGNTAPSSVVVRDGDGVYERIRSRKSGPKMKVLGYLRPDWSSSTERYP